MPDVQTTDLVLAQATAEDAHAVVQDTHDIEQVGGAHLEIEGADLHGAAAEHGAVHHYPRHVDHPPEPPHFIQVLWEQEAHVFETEGRDPYWNPEDGGEPTLLQTLHVGQLEKPLPMVDYAPWENHVYLFIGMFVLLAIGWAAARPFRRPRREMLRNPTRMQIAAEVVTAGSVSFCEGILGEENGKRYFPFISTLFFLVLTLNLLGMVPLMRAPTASVMITGSLAISTFLYYMWTAITRLGPLTFAHHLLGSPQTAIQWVLSPLFLLLECVSYFFAKPLSLALRLFGNILGKDILFGCFLFLGIGLVSAFSESAGQYIGIPLTYPFYFLGLLLSAIQALVFALLSAIYILMVLPHDHEHHDEHYDVVGGSDVPDVGSHPEQVAVKV